MYQLVLDARALLVRVDEEAEHVLCRGAAMATDLGVLLLLFWSWGQGGVIGLLARGCPHAICTMSWREMCQGPSLAPLALGISRRCSARRWQTP